MTVKGEDYLRLSSPLLQLIILALLDVVANREASVSVEMGLQRSATISTLVPSQILFKALLILALHHLSSSSVNNRRTLFSVNNTKVLL